MVTGFGGVGGVRRLPVWSVGCGDTETDILLFRGETSVRFLRYEVDMWTTRGTKMASMDYWKGKNGDAQCCHGHVGQSSRGRC